MPEASPGPAAWVAWPERMNFKANHGVTVNAMASEIAMPRLELMGMGPM